MTFSFPLCIPSNSFHFFLFFCLRFEALYSKGMKKNGSSCYRHASIWDAFSFFCLLLCWQWPCSWLPLWMLRCDPHNPTLSTTYLKKGLDFFVLSKVFSLSNESFILVLILLCFYGEYVYWFIFVEPFQQLWSYAWLIIFDNLFGVFLYKVCRYFIEIIYLFT